MSSAATASCPETARYLRSGAEHVFAVYTSPLASRTDLGVVLAHSGANNFSAHRNGVWTHLSRRLARAGIPSLRFDFAGTGESSGEFVRALAGQPIRDATAAMDALRAAGSRRLLVVGSCFGAIPGVVAGAGREDVTAVVLLSPPLVRPDAGGVTSVREKVREVANRQTLRAVVTDREYRGWFWARHVGLARTKAAVMVSRPGMRPPANHPPEAGPGPSRGLLMESELARLVTAGRHVEVVYGTCDANLACVHGDPDAWHAVSLLRDRRPAGLVWTVLDGSVHGLEDVAIQEQLIRLVLGRARDLTGPPPRAAGR